MPGKAEERYLANEKGAKHEDPRLRGWYRRDNDHPFDFDRTCGYRNLLVARNDERELRPAHANGENRFWKNIRREPAGWSSMVPNSVKPSLR